MVKEGIVFLLLMSIIISGVAQEEKPVVPSFRSFRPKEQVSARPNVIKGQPLRLLLGRIPYGSELHVSYERMLAPRHSIVVSANFNFPGLLWLIPSDSVNPGRRFSWILGGGIRGHYRFYPLRRHKGPRGYFLGPVVSYNYGKLQYKSGMDFIRFDQVDAGVITGYQWIVLDDAVIELFGGLGYRTETIRYWDENLQQYEDITRQVNRSLGPLSFLRSIQLYFGFSIGGLF